ncbi:MAG: hydroxyisourate hydrolase [Bdellovibrionales bacterium]|nr:hydroxyisourate hydrolase [Bdellovibrionales bacterium]
MISTHVLDTSSGTPGVGVAVKLQIKSGSSWTSVATGVTNSDGRFVFDCEKTAGTYQLTFEIEDYLKKHSQEYFFLAAPVIFKISDTARKYHVPLLLNPFGYSTYRGT